METPITPEQVPDDMVWIPGGTFQMGANDHYPEERPIHSATVAGFWMDKFEVSNEQFARFVNETKYVTLAERPAKVEDYPGAKTELLAPSSVVFHKPLHPVDLHNHFNWWTYIPGADWRHPEGPNSSIEGRRDHPVVHIAWEDVEAYAKWARKELPTEAEWEFAARGGLDGATFAWGNELAPGGKQMANIWQGEFPWQNLRLDGYERTSPVGHFPANGYGLFDMAGNVWEWTADWYEDHHTVAQTCCGNINPRGGAREKSYDPRLLDILIPRRVIKGGSFLCAKNYCRRYRPAARMAQPIDTSTCHVGFRLVARNKTGAEVTEIRKQKTPSNTESKTAHAGEEKRDT
jgi:formylglycine-generating enzyme required for sulfatase activity